MPFFPFLKEYQAVNAMPKGYRITKIALDILPIYRFYSDRADYAGGCPTGRVLLLIEESPDVPLEVDGIVEATQHISNST
jgi:hypothetical protein